MSADQSNVQWFSQDAKKAVCGWFGAIRLLGFDESRLTRMRIGQPDVPPGAAGARLDTVARCRLAMGGQPRAARPVLGEMGVSAEGGIELFPDRSFPLPFPEI
ncbi:hypothetical protein [Micromonospora sp. NPDC001898]|uniref:hypothetical protein n=1 Tax=Micromonospora sp. NPDC001898 TaxID=3364221 RepID=UPI00369A3A5F